MKLCDLAKYENLKGKKVKTTDGQVGYWVSQWEAGVWLSKTEDGNGRIYPIFVNSLKECLNWELTDEPVNLKEV